jgi:hypothetical protein
VTLIASGAYDLVLVELIKVDMQSQSARLRQRARFLRGVAYLYQFKWEQARSVFQVYFDEIPSAAGAAAEIDALFLDALNRSQKSEKAARLLSTFLPGLGQTYAGDWKNGLNALLLNGVLGYITLDAAIERDYDDALLSFFFLFYRYYAGNRYRAVEAAQTFNDWENRRHVEKILQALATQFAEGKRKE